MKNLYGYDLLIEDFLNKKISAKEFRTSYFDKFKNEKNFLDDNFFDTLDWLFAEADGYTTNQELLAKKPDFYIDEEQLRESAAKTLQEIRALK